MSQELNNLVELMARLRAPDGCPWDRRQTHDSLKPYLLEETYEVLEAIDAGDPGSLKEELGDLLLQVLFHSQIASERSEFTFNEIADHLAQKLVRRHPHVFQKQHDQEGIHSADQVAHQWETIKSQEKQDTARSNSLLDGIPKVSPALQRAHQVQKRVARGGFDWKSAPPVLNKLREEFDELFVAASQAFGKEASPTPSDHQSQTEREIEAELGDVLFSVVNVARFLKVNPEEALRKATNRFIHRFHFLEKQAAQQKRAIGDCSDEELDRWWEEAKLKERS
ncbi:MAG: nucleoside triphosphate pyrophosphohydrolase [Nitrospirota bacterium]|nr:MAG: nucleoside triphosphate pyrophosphohydrolase [Nitrospirota bacterium]